MVERRDSEVCEPLYPSGHSVSFATLCAPHNYIYAGIYDHYNNNDRGQCGFIAPLVRTTTATVLHWGIYRLACGGYDLDPYTY